MPQVLPRIAFVTTVYDQTSVGGGTFVHYLRDAVERDDVDIVFFSDDIRMPTKEFEHKVEIPHTFRRLPGGWLWRSYFFNQAVRKAHSERPFDIIWHNNVITGIWDVTHPFGAPVVGMINDYSNADSKTIFATRAKFGAYRAAIRYVWRHLERYSARRAARVVVNSAYMARQIGAAYELNEERIRLLYKGVDLRRFEFTPVRPLRLPIKILFIKRDYIRGGLLELLDALSNFPAEVELTVVGPPVDCRASILEAARRLGVASKVHVIDPVNRDEIGVVFRNHDILCIPSRSEALGVAFMEALASGLPAIGTRTGGIPEVLDEGRAGWLVEPADPACVRQVLEEVIQNEALRVEKRNHGRLYVAKFSRDNMISRMSAIAQDVAKEYA